MRYKTKSNNRSNHLFLCAVIVELRKFRFHVGYLRSRERKFHRWNFRSH